MRDNRGDLLTPSDSPLDTAWLHYKSVFSSVSDAQDVKTIEVLGMRVSRLADTVPLILFFFKMFQRARGDIFRHLRESDVGDKQWTEKYLKLLTVNARAEAALSALITMAEVGSVDATQKLSLRLSKAVDLVSHAFNKGLISFERPSVFGYDHLIGVLRGDPGEVVLPIVHTKQKKAKS